MKLAITIYPEDFAEADRILHQLRGVRSVELDGYMGKAHVEKVFDKPVIKTLGELEAESDEGFVNPGFESNCVVNPTSSFNTRPNVSPGEPSIGKIGAATKLQIINELRDEHQAGTKYAEHLKLLWKRGEVKYDGKAYYL